MLAVAAEAGRGPDPGPGVPTRPASTAIFALSQACLHEACKERLLALGLPALMQRLAALRDPDLASNIKRIQVRS